MKNASYWRRFFSVLQKLGSSWKETCAHVRFTLAADTSLAAKGFCRCFPSRRQECVKRCELTMRLLTTFPLSKASLPQSSTRINETVIAVAVAFGAMACSS